MESETALTAKAHLLSRRQRSLIAIAYLTYASYYLGRVNLSAALPAMETSLNLGKDALGMLGTGFFWTYAIGTLVNGRLGDVLSPRRLVFAGMLISALLNLVFGLSSTFLILLLIWSTNGLFQATGWGPVLRTLSNWLNPDQRRRVSGLFGSSFVVGNAATWLLTGWLVARFSWRWAFWIPALLLTSVAAVWSLFVQDTPADAGWGQETAVTDDGHSFPSIALLLAGVRHSLHRFWPLAVAGACLGYCLVALLIWTPTYFVEVGGVNIGAAATLATLTPIAGIVGALALGWLVGRFLDTRESSALTISLLVLASFFALQLVLPANLVLLATTMMVIGGLAYGATSLTLSVLPLTLSNRDEASTTAGLLDFSFSLGGGLSGWSIGIILENSTWDAVFVNLAVAALCSAFFVVFGTIRQPKRSAAKAAGDNRA